MVLLNASKQARNIASLVNRPTCGGNKKAGLAPSTGYFFLTSNIHLRGAGNTQYGLTCIPSPTIQTQKYGYRATRTGRLG